MYVWPWPVQLVSSFHGLLSLGVGGLVALGVLNHGFDLLVGEAAGALNDYALLLARGLIHTYIHTYKRLRIHALEDSLGWGTLSLALTWRMPSASMSKETSICGMPRGDGGMPISSNSPRLLLSAAISRSPCRTLIWTWNRGEISHDIHHRGTLSHRHQSVCMGHTCVWLSAAVEKVWAWKKVNRCKYSTF